MLSLGQHHALTHGELSSVFGWVSIACWVVVYTPQIWENYCTSSGEGLSLAFIVLWLVGDLTNLWGGVLAGLLPTMNILALYYTICDVILLIQVFYYRRERASAIGTLEVTISETTPLVSEQAEAKPRSWWSRSAVLLACLGLVIGTGVVAWEVHSRTIPETPHGAPGSEPVEDVLEWRSQALGWISAITYIASRIPQIIKNQSTRCEGLSLVMFFFSITGNVTYVTSILVKSTRSHYIKANLPWLAGSGLTVFLDIIVLGQFLYYSRHPAPLALQEADDLDSD